MVAGRRRGPRRFGLVCDLGGTNVRFGIGALDGRNRLRVEGTSSFAVKDHAGLIDAAKRYLEVRQVATPPTMAVFAVAAPVRRGQVRLTNSGWHFSAAALREGLHIRSVRIVNDFEALARSLPLLGSRDHVPIGKPPRAELRQSRRSRAFAILGPGTGLGVSGLVSDAGSFFPLASEGGHIGVSPFDDMEIQILRILRQSFGRVSAERILSGPGLLNLHRAMALIEGVSVEAPEHPEAITAQARNDPDSLGGRVFARFCAMLGSVAGDVALTMGARAGVFIAGGLLTDMPDTLNASGFRMRFEAKGRLEGYMRHIPTRLIVRSDAALLGAASLLVRPRAAVTQR